MSLSPALVLSWPSPGADGISVEEDMLEVDCSVLTPHAVFKTSGHTDRFADWMCKDPKTGEIMRADHFVEDVLETRLKADREARGHAEGHKMKDPKRAKKALGQKLQAARLEDAVAEEYERVLARIDNYDGAGLAELIDKYDLRCPSGERPTPPVAFNLMCELYPSNVPGEPRTTFCRRGVSIANNGWRISSNIHRPKQ